MIHKRLAQFDIRSIAESGQCFRLYPAEGDRYELIAHGRALSIAGVGAGEYAFDCGEAEFARIWAPYFDLDTDYRRFLDVVPPEDDFLREAALFGGGIRILRQDPWETLITFILSQRKNIPAIRRCVEALCTRYGAPIEGAPGRFAFPTPQALAAACDAELRCCALGYRAGYVAEAARRVASGEADLAAWGALDDDALQQALQSLPGVGPKVAHCVMLFGYHRIRAFPRDVWINRILAEEYGGDFPLERFEGFAGVIQQYMFYYGRLRGKQS